MSDSRLKVVSIPPSGADLQRLVAKHCRRPGLLTSFSDSRLLTLRAHVPDNSACEVISFGDLTRRVCNVCAELSLPLATTGQVRAALNLELKKLDESSPFFTSSSFSGLHERLMEVLHEFRMWDYRAEDLEAISSGACDSLHSKLLSIAQLMRGVDGVLEDAGRELVSDRISRMLELNPSRDMSHLGRLLVLAGGEICPLYVPWLTWLASRGVEVILVVEQLSGRDELFEGSAQTVSLAKCAATSSGSEPWYHVLFTSNESPADAPEVRVHSCYDLLAECEWALRGCLEAAAEGIGYHKMVILARDVHTYAPLINATAKRLGVPLKASLQVPLLTNSFANLILAILEMLAGRDLRRLAPLLKSSYLRLSHEERNIVASQLGVLLKDSAPWNSLQEWAQAAEEDEHLWLRHLLNWRAKTFDQRHQLDQWISLLRELMTCPPLEAVPTDQNPTKERDLRANDAMFRALGEYASVYSNSESDEFALADFVRLCKLLWEREDTVHPSPSVGGVHLVSSIDSVSEAEVLFVLGMLEGVLPRRRVENAILSDEDRAYISGCFPEKIPLKDSFRIAREERDLFVRICGAGSRSIVFSYPQTEEERDNVPAFYLTELERAYGARLIRRDFLRRLLVPPPGECLSPADLAISQALNAPRQELTAPCLVSDEAREALVAPIETGVQPTELASSLQCAFRSAFRHRLELHPANRQNPYYRLRHLPARVGLAGQPTALAARTALQEELKMMIGELLPDLEPWEASLIEAAGERLSNEWVKREFDAREQWKKEEGSVLLDVPLGSFGLRDEVPVDGRKVRLKDIVPAVSALGNYSVIHLYESSMPNLTKDDKKSVDEYDMFRLGLYLMVQYKRRNECAIEIDSTTGKRGLVVLSRFASDVPKDNKATGLSVCRIIDDWGVFMRNIKEQLRRAIKVMDQCRLDACPGNHCEGCRYGEICRVSSEYGESMSIFDSLEVES